MLKNIGNEEQKESNKIKVSIIIPCRNEEKYIGKCLESVIYQDYAKDNLEVLVIDGLSKDNTKEIIENYSHRYNFIRYLENPKKITPCALNIGIKNAKGDIVIRMDAHAKYEKYYVSKCVKYLYEYEVDNIGGTMVTLPQNDTFIGKAVVVALSHRFGVGGSIFRTGTNEPRYVDTVFGGCYKREVFNKIGLFNERLIRNQDLEFNLRLKKAGGKILLVPEIVSYYYARVDLKGLFKQNFWNGFWVIYSTKFARMPFSVRHLIPFFFVLSICGSLILSFIYRFFIYMFVLVFVTYLISNILFSLKTSFKKGFKYFIPLMLSFATLHFSYGFGSMDGLIKLLWERIRRIV